MLGIVGVCLAAPVLSTSAAAADPPQRIISLTPAITEIVFALDAGDRLVGVSTACDYPRAARAIDSVGTFVTPAVERIVAKRPDLILAEPNVGNRNPVESLRRMGLEVLIVDPDTLAQAKVAFVTIARRLGVEARGRELVEKVEGEIERTVEALGDAPLRSTLFVVSRKPLIVAGTGTLQDEMISLARGRNVGAVGGDGWPHLSLEQVIAAAPEVLIDASMGSEGGEEQARAFWTRFASLPAVRDGRVTVYGSGEVFRPGPRIGDALAEVARRIHPERFTGRGD